MFQHETKGQLIKTNASEKNVEAKSCHFSAMVGVQANELPIQTLENAFKGNDKLTQVVDQFKH